MSPVFALNHMTFCRLRYDALISLARTAGCVGVEFRNDLPGPLFDGDSPALVREVTSSAGMRIFALAEVKMFNDWTSRRHREAEDLMSNARAIGASAVSLIPRNDGIGCSNGERQANLRMALQELLPLLERHDLAGLVEPLGFESSSVRFKAEVVDAIEALGGSGRILLIHDTFHHYLSGEDEVFSAYTGMVHVSGVAGSQLSARSMLDGHRGLVYEDDRLGNIDQLYSLQSSGYSGPVSFEAFSPCVHSVSDPLDALTRSMEFIRFRLGRQSA